MPIPVLPALLLAVASVAIIASRFLHLPVKRVNGLVIYLLILLLASVLRSNLLVATGVSEQAIEASPFLDDALVCSEHWLILILGILAGIAVVDAHRCQQATLGLYGFLFFVLASLMLVASSNDFLALGLALELMQVSLIALQQAESPRTICDDDSHRLTLRPVPEDWRSGIESGFLWSGIAILAACTGTTSFDSVRHTLSSFYENNGEYDAIGAPSKLILLGTGLIAISLCAKLGLAPFYLGVGSHGGHDCVVLKTVSRMTRQLAGAITLTRLCAIVFVGLSQPLMALFVTICLTSFVISAIMAIRGRATGVMSINWWLASLNLIQSSWLGIALIIASTELQHPELRAGAFESSTDTIAVCVFMQFVNLLAGCGMSWSLAHLARTDREIVYLEDLKGLVHFATIDSFILIVALASAIGTPLTAGFWARWMTFMASANVHVKVSNIFTPHSGLRMVMLIGTVSTMVVASIVIRLAREILLESPLARPSADGGRGPLIASGISSILILAIGIFPQLLSTPLKSIPAPRAEKRDIPVSGSGTVPLGFRQPARIRDNTSAAS